MKQFTTILIVLVLISCGPEKSVQIPEIQNATIIDIKDVSPAYIFYDETKPDSVALNRKNLIISTNWLVNVDKRLTLKQALPSIIKLQEKKRNAKMHKNENARNYYTCNDTSIKNLGFIDFTDVIYESYLDESIEEISLIDNAFNVPVIVKSINEIVIDSYFNESTTEINTFINELKSEMKAVHLDDPDHGGDFISIKLCFNRNLSFQDYITIKSKLINFEMENVVIKDNEYIY